VITSTKPFRLAAIAAIAIVVGACTTSATPSPAATAATTAPTAEASPTAPTGELPKPEQTNLKVGLSAGGEMSQFSGELASSQKIYDKYGLNVEVTVFEGDGKAVSALQAGQIDIAFTGTSSAISSQLTDAPYVILAVNAMVVTDDLVCQSAIKTKADLKGKKIAISTFGGSSNASALLAVKSLDMALTDVVITQVGGEGARVAALVGGSIDCAIVDQVREPEMTAQGFSILVQLKKAAIAYGRSGVGVLKDWLAKNPNTALNVVAAILEAQNLIWDKPDVAAADFATFTQIDADKATTQVKDFQTVGNRSLMWTDEAFKNAQKVIAIINPDIIDVNLADAYDRSILEKLVDLGFYAKIGAPVPSTTP
jgi:ABC-type nitrate/sulfonate/bicarbonate transport system substrate-binding protein